MLSVRPLENQTRNSVLKSWTEIFLFSSFFKSSTFVLLRMFMVRGDFGCVCACVLQICTNWIKYLRCRSLSCLTMCSRMTIITANRIPAGSVRFNVHACGVQLTYVWQIVMISSPPYISRSFWVRSCPYHYLSEVIITHNFGAGYKLWSFILRNFLQNMSKYGALCDVSYYAALLTPRKAEDSPLSRLLIQRGVHIRRRSAPT